MVFESRNAAHQTAIYGHSELLCATRYRSNNVDALGQGSMDSVHAFTVAVTFVVATKDNILSTRSNTAAKRRMNLVASAA